MNLTTYFKNVLLDHFVGNLTYAVPGTYYGALLTNPTFEDGDIPVEPSGNGYSRVAIPNNKSVFSLADQGVVDNAEEIAFVAATGGNWETTPWFALYDQITGGNLLMWGPVDALTGDPITVLDGTFANIRTGSLTVSA